MPIKSAQRCMLLSVNWISERKTRLLIKSHYQINYENYNHSFEFEKL